jgi:hypothetical protein
MTGKTLVPFVHNNGLTVPNGIKKAFVHPNQIFSSGVTGKPSDCFQYCLRYEQLPEGTLPVNDVIFESSESYIAIELGNTCIIQSIRYGPTTGTISVLQGEFIHNLAERIVLNNESGGTGVPVFSKTKTKLIVFMAEAGTKMPAIEIISNKTIFPMPNPALEPKFCDPNEMMVTLDGIRLPTQDVAPIQKSLIPDKLYVIDSNWARASNNEKAVRLNPCVVNGIPLSIDDNLFFIKQQVKGNISLAIKTIDLYYGIKLFWYCLMRYGNHKRFVKNPDLDPLFTDIDWIYTNSKGMKFQNLEKTGLKLINSIMLWPENRFISPDAYAEKQVEIFIMAKKTDISISVKSMPMPPIPDYLYFAYRHGLDQTGSPPWDEIVVSVESDQELEDLQVFMGTYQKYCKKFPITVIINYPVKPEKWPGIFYYCMLIGIDKTVITNEIEIYNIKKQKSETIFEPNILYKNFVNWRLEIKNRKPVTVQIMNDITMVISKIPKTRNWVEHFMFSYNSNLKTNPLVEGTPVTMPIGHHLNDRRQWRSYDLEDKKILQNQK